MKNKLYLPNLNHSPIDIHSHFNHGTTFDTPQTEAHIRDLEFVEAEYKRVGVASVGMSSFAAVTHPECIEDENTYLHKLIDQNDMVYQWVVIDPRQKETYTQAEKMLLHPKVLGIKIHPSYHGYELCEFSDELFSFANERRAVVLMHPQKISEMPRLIDDYPDMKLIIAHLGSTEYIDAIQNARHGNIYTDTSGSASSLNNIVEYAVSRVGPKKILFGTDTYSFAFQFGRIALSSLSFEDKENIFWKNALKLFPEAFNR